MPSMNVFFVLSSFFTNYVFILVLTNVLTLSSAQNCKSFEDQVGTCISIKRCPVALRLIEANDGIVDGGNVRRLQKITCGFEGDDPKVCCPSNLTDERRSKSEESRSGRTHPNFNLLPAFSDCGEQKVMFADRIIGGRTPILGFFPWLARIGYRVGRGKTEYFCGGSVINKRYVLTAAHCTIAENENQRPISVRLGEHDVSQNPDCSDSSGCSYVKEYKISQIISYPSYNQASKKNDIALLRLDKDIDFSTFVQPVCLPFTKEYVLRRFPNFLETTEDSGIVAGWGRTRYDRAEESRMLQYVSVPIVPNQRCNDIYVGKTKISSSQICAGGISNEDSCDGDSGGPLIYSYNDTRRKIGRFFQIAIVSYGPTKCGTRGLPGIYANTSEYLRWILDNIHS